MALWGNKDSKTATGTIAIATNGTVTGTGTAFTTEAKIGNYIRADGRDYVIVTITNNTTATVKSGVNGGAITAVTAGASYALSEKPAFVALSESSGSPAGVHGDSNKVFGVDVVEIKQPTAEGVAHSGWVRRIEGTGGRAGRVITEVLVANSTITGDADDDAVFPNLTIIITEQPADQTVEDGDTANFSVDYEPVSNVEFTIQWQVSTDGGETWIDAEDETDFDFNVQSIDGAYVDGNQFRAVITGGGATATSNAATLTITPE